MGNCFSWSTILSYGNVNGNGNGDDNDKPTVHVISLNGDLHQYPLPVTVSYVLQSEESTSPSSSSFLCNSDRLSFDEFIPSMKSDDDLEAGQIYFVLLKSKLQHKLSSSDMAALAVKASVALQKSGLSSSSSSRRRRKNNHARIAPVVLDQHHEQQNEAKLINKNGPGKASGLGGLNRSGSVRRLQRYSSQRAKLAVRSFRLTLSTIYEGSILQYNSLEK